MAFFVILKNQFGNKKDVNLDVARHATSLGHTLCPELVEKTQSFMQKIIMTKVY